MRTSVARTIMRVTSTKCAIGIRPKAAVLTPLTASRQLLVGFLEAGERRLDANALLRRLEDAQRRRLPGLQLVEQAFVHRELGDAAIGNALQEAQAPRFRVVDPQGYAGG